MDIFLIISKMLGLFCAVVSQGIAINCLVTDTLTLQNKLKMWI
jgi:hypothetical protein